MKGIYQHFRAEEREMLTLLNSKFESATNNYYAVLTDFLNPREQKMIESLNGYYPDITVHFYGGGNNSERERLRAILLPEYFEYTLDDFEITVFEVSYPDKFVTLSHRNLLGAIMSIGVDRSIIGDIVNGDKTQFAVTKPFTDLFKTELTRIKNAPLKLTEIPHTEFVEANVKMRPMTILSTSYRLDSVVALVLKEGRTKSKERVEKEKVKVNHSIVDEPSFIIETGDIISVRGFGRFIVTELIQQTKKGKYRLEVMIVADN